MSVSPYTLEGLYNKGVLDYVPYELCNGANVSSLNVVQNPYLDMAKQGGLYQDYSTDNFQYQNVQNNGYADNNIYSNQGNAGMNSIGTLGFNQSVMNASGINPLGTNPNSPNGTLGSDSREAFMNSMQEGIMGEKVGKKEKSKSFNLIKGLIAGGIIIGTTYLCLKGKKQPSSGNFLSKLKFWKK